MTTREGWTGKIVSSQPARQESFSRGYQGALVDIAEKLNAGGPDAAWQWIRDNVSRPEFRDMVSWPYMDPPAPVVVSCDNCRRPVSDSLVRYYGDVLGLDWAHCSRCAHRVPRADPPC